MTTRYSAFLVTLDKDIREDDAEASVLTALRCIRGVVSVEPVVADALVQEAAMNRARSDLVNAIWPVLFPNIKREPR